MKRKRILLISHDSSFSGASLSFCFLAEELVQLNKDVDFDIYLLGEGPLVEKYRKNFQNVYFPYRLSENFISRNIRKIARKVNLLESYKDKLIQKLADNNYDLIIGNTVGSLEWLTFLKIRNSRQKTVVVIHELDIIIKNFYPKPSKFRTEILNCEQIIAVSNATRINLMDKYDVESEKIRVINPYLHNAKTFEEKILRTESDTYRIGIIGYLSLIKGSDLVPKIAQILKIKFGVKNFSIIFFGVENNEGQNSLKNVILNDADKLGVAENIFFVEKEKTPISFFENMDVFLMISREESFSLATVESVLSETPVVLFDGIGGPDEILMKDEAYFSPFLDLDSIAQNLFEIYSDRSIAYIKILRAKERILINQNKCLREYNQIILDYA